jgi:hypothetical protein
MSGDKRKKRNRLITNFWVAKPKKLATPRCFYETRVIESKSKTRSLMCKEKETNYSARKQECLSLNPTQTPDWFSSSLHAIRFRKTKEILDSLMQRRMKLRKSLDRGSHRNGRNATRDRDGCIRMRMTILYEDGPDETTSERNARWKTLK